MVQGRALPPPERGLIPPLFPIHACPHPLSTEQRPGRGLERDTLYPKVKSSLQQVRHSSLFYPILPMVLAGKSPFGNFSTTPIVEHNISLHSILKPI